MPAGVTIPKAAAALGVSQQMLRRYVGMGMPAAGIDARGRVLLDPEAAAAWIAAQVAGEGGHGGTRRGAGRPRADGAPPAGGRTGPGDEPRGGPSEPTAPPGPDIGEEELRAMLADPAALVRSLGKITFAQTRRLRDGLRAAEELAQHQQRMGELVSVHEHAQALARILGEVRRRLDEIPARASRAVGDELSLTHARVGRVRLILEKEVARCCAAIAGTNTPTPPITKTRKRKS